MTKSKEVDAWLARYENPMKAVVLRIREIILAADPRITECIKWQAPTFTYRGNLASFFPKSKQHASLMFHDGANIPGKHAILEGTADKGRSIKLATVAAADKAKPALVKVVKAWCDWRDEVEGAAKPKGYDEATAQRIREVLGPNRDVVERKMFGGLCFMVDGKMCCGLTKDSFMARVGKDGHAKALAQPHVRPMTFTGRPLAGFVYVDPPGYKTKAALTKWVELGLDAEPPVKRPKTKPKAKR